MKDDYTALFYRLPQAVGNKSLSDCFDGIDLLKFSVTEASSLTGAFLKHNPSLKMAKEWDEKTHWITQSFYLSHFLPYAVNSKTEDFEVFQWLWGLLKQQNASFELSVQSQETISKALMSCDRFDGVLKMFDWGVLDKDIFCNHALRLASDAIYHGKENFVLNMHQHGLLSEDKLKIDDYRIVRLAISGMFSRLLSRLWDDFHPQILEFCKNNKSWKAFDHCLTLLSPQQLDQACLYVQPLLQRSRHAKDLALLPNLRVILEKKHLEKHVQSCATSNADAPKMPKNNRKI